MRINHIKVSNIDDRYNITLSEETVTSNTFKELLSNTTIDGGKREGFLEFIGEAKPENELDMLTPLVGKMYFTYLLYKDIITKEEFSCIISEIK